MLEPSIALPDAASQLRVCPQASAPRLRRLKWLGVGLFMARGREAREWRWMLGGVMMSKLWSLQTSLMFCIGCGWSGCIIYYPSWDISGGGPLVLSHSNASAAFHCFENCLSILFYLEIGSYLESLELTFQPRLGYSSRSPCLSLLSINWHCRQIPPGVPVSITIPLLRFEPLWEQTSWNCG